MNVVEELLEVERQEQYDPSNIGEPEDFGYTGPMPDIATILSGKVAV